ncbi:MAG: hypothetical protein RL404_2012 [Pseudomonadota bacterium]
MTTSILSIGQSALAAAQVGLAITGHNIANSATPGYTRQIVEQGAVAGQNSGYGFVGKGTEVTGVRRVYSEFLSGQVLSAQINKSSLDTYYAQIQRIDNLLADPSAGVSPALQDFFKSVQNLAAQPNDAASRQAMLSSSESLAARFNGLDSQLADMRAGVNGQIESSVASINAYARQIGNLNEAIEKATTAAQGRPPNDLMDQRDQLIAELGKEVRVTVVPQGNSSNVFIGNGQPLVVGDKAYALAATSSPTDSNRTMVAYVAKGKTTILAEGALPGGRLGGLFDFRAQTLDPTQNALGRIAIVLGDSVNAQHRLGQTATGMMGTDLFRLPTPLVTASRDNTGTGQASAVIQDSSQLTASDYRVQFDGSHYHVTRLSDDTDFSYASLPQDVDGLTISLSGTPATGDEFLLRPTAGGASGLKVMIKDVSALAAAAPVRAQAMATNAGTGAISAGMVDTTFLPANIATPVALQFSSVGHTLTGFPAVPVTVTANGVSTTYAAGATIPFVADASYSFNGMQVTLSGSPSNGDQFSIAANTGGVGDARNVALIADLQNAMTVGGKTAHFQGAYAMLVADVGNKTRELEVTSAAAGTFFTQAVTAQQGESGVNLDEEAANMMRYQQAYQAAGKLMQAAGQLFDILLELGH